MSNQNELQTVHHALKDIERQIGKISGRLGWILILAIASLVLSLISFAIVAAK